MCSCVTGYDVCRRVAFGVPDMKPCARGVWKHIENVGLGPVPEILVFGIGLAECPLFRPVFLPYSTFLKMEQEILRPYCSGGKKESKSVYAVTAIREGLLQCPWK